MPLPSVVHSERTPLLGLTLATIMTLSISALAIAQPPEYAETFTARRIAAVASEQLRATRVSVSRLKTDVLNEPGVLVRCTLTAEAAKPLALVAIAKGADGADLGRSTPLVVRLERTPGRRWHLDRDVDEVFEARPAERVKHFETRTIEY